jgi:hypothetical protein
MEDITVNDQQEEKKTVFQRIRASVLPIKPTDSVPVKVAKQVGFAAFSVVAAVVTALLAIAVAFAL